MFYLADFAYKPLSKEKLNKIENNISRQDRIAKQHWAIVGQEKSLGKYNLSKQNPELFEQKKKNSKLKPDLEGIEKSNKQIENILGKQKRLNRLRASWDSKDQKRGLDGFADSVSKESFLGNEASKVNNKVKPNRLGLKVLGSAILAGGALYGLNQLRKSRSDKGKTRGKYK